MFITNKNIFLTFYNNKKKKINDQVNQLNVLLVETNYCDRRSLSLTLPTQPFSFTGPTSPAAPALRRPSSPSQRLSHKNVTFLAFNPRPAAMKTTPILSHGPIYSKMKKVNFRDFLIDLMFFRHCSQWRAARITGISVKIRDFIHRKNADSESAVVFSLYIAKTPNYFVMTWISRLRSMFLIPVRNKVDEEKKYYLWLLSAEFGILCFYVVWSKLSIKLKLILGVSARHWISWDAFITALAF